MTPHPNARATRHAGASAAYRTPTRPSAVGSALHEAPTEPCAVATWTVGQRHRIATIAGVSVAAVAAAGLGMIVQPRVREAVRAACRALGLEAPPAPAGGC